MKKTISAAFLIIIFVSLFSFLLLPTLASAAANVGDSAKPGWTGLVPCGRNTGTDAEKAPCTLCHLVVGFQRLTQYALYMVVTLALVGIFFAGVMYMVSSGDENMMTKAKTFLKVSLTGFALVILAWLIVNVTLWVLGARGDLGIGITKWNEFTCSTKSTQGTGGQATTSNAGGTMPSNTNGNNYTTGQSCGQDNKGTCYTGGTEITFMCPSGYSHLTGGTDCSKGWCCVKN